MKPKPKEAAKYYQSSGNQGHFTLFFLFSIIAATIVAVSHAQWTEPLWATPFSVISFAAGQLLVRKSRANPQILLCPHNLILYWMFGALVLSPVSGLYSGFVMGPLPALPAYQFGNLAIIIYNLSYWSYLFGFAVIQQRQPQQQYAGKRLILKNQTLSPAHTPILFILVTVGFIGSIIRFGSIGDLISFFSDTKNIGVAASRASLSATQVVGNLLRPAAFVGTVALWANWVLRNRAKGKPFLVSVSVLWLVAMLIANLSFNRGSLLVAIIAIFGLVEVSFGALRKSLLVPIAVGLWIGLIVLGEIRGSTQVAVDAYKDIDIRADIVETTKPLDNLQVYFGGPQFLGYLLEQIDESRKVYGGETIIASIMFPVPVIGEAFRSTAGVTIFNELIYGRSSAFLDQILPSQGEVWLNFRIFGIVPFYLMFGVGAGLIQRKYMYAAKTRSGAVLVCWILVGFWYSMLAVGSIAAVSQIFLYQALPAIVIILLDRSPTSISTNRHV